MSVVWIVLLAVVALLALAVLVPMVVLAFWSRAVHQQRAWPVRVDSGPQRRWRAVREYERTGDAETTQPLPPVREQR